MAGFNYLQLALALQRTFGCDWQRMPVKEYIAAPSSDPFEGLGTSEFGHNLARPGTFIFRRSRKGRTPVEVSVSVPDMDQQVTDHMLHHICEALELKPEKVAQSAFYQEHDRERDS